MSSLERFSEYRGFGLERFHCIMHTSFTYSNAGNLSVHIPNCRSESHMSCLVVKYTYVRIRMQKQIIPANQ